MVANRNQYLDMDGNWTECGQHIQIRDKICQRILFDHMDGGGQW